MSSARSKPWLVTFFVRRCVRWCFSWIPPQETNSILCEQRGNTCLRYRTGNKLHPISERHYGATIKGHLKPLNTIVLWWFKGFQGILQLDTHDAERRQSLGQLCVWSLLFLQPVTVQYWEQFTTVQLMFGLSLSESAISTYVYTNIYIYIY